MEASRAGWSIVDIAGQLDVDLKSPNQQSTAAVGDNGLAVLISSYNSIAY